MNFEWKFPTISKIQLMFSEEKKAPLAWKK